jgi:hypothetical protein
MRLGYVYIMDFEPIKFVGGEDSWCAFRQGVVYGRRVLSEEI